MIETAPQIARRSGWRCTCQRAALLIAPIALWGPIANAAEDLVGTRATAMAGALRASAAGTEGVLLNPAGMSIARQYVVGALYQFRAADSASQLNATVVDSVTSRIAAGLSYSYVHAAPQLTLARPDGGLALDQTRQTHEVAMALSMPFGDWLLFGVSGKYLNHQVDLSSPSEDELTAASISDFSMDIGGIIRLGDMLRVAVVGYNLIPVDDALYPQSLGVGGALSLSQSITAAFDSVIDFTSDPDKTTASFHGGLEAFLAQRYAVRAGVEHSTYLDATHVAGGFGFVTRALGLELSVRQQVDGGKSTLVSAALQYFVQ